MISWQKLVPNFRNPLNSIKNFKLLDSWKLALGIIALSLAGIYLIVVSFWLNIPEEKLRDYLATKIPLPENTSIAIDAIETSWVGLNMRGVLIDHASFDAVRFNEVRLNLISWRLFIFQVPIYAQINQNLLQANYDFRQEKINFTVNELRLNDLAPIRSTGIFNRSPQVSLKGSWQQATNDLVLEAKITAVELKTQNTPLAVVSLVGAGLPEALVANYIDANLTWSQESKNAYLNISGSYTGKVELLANWNQTIFDSSYRVLIDGTINRELIDDPNSILSIFLQPYLSGRRLNLTISFQGAFENLQINNNS